MKKRRSIVQIMKSLVSETCERNGLEGFNFILTEFDIFEQLNRTHEPPRLLITKNNIKRY